MNFNENNAKSAAGQAGYVAGIVGASPAFPQNVATEETLGGVQQDCLKCAHELNTLLDSIADAIGGPAIDKNPPSPSGTTLKAHAWELRTLLNRAMSTANRIGSNL